MKPMNPQKEGIVNYARWVIKWRYLIVLVTILATLGIVSGGRFLSFTSSYKVFFGKSNPFLESFEEIQNVYSKSESVLMVLAPKDGQVFSQSFLSAVEELTQDAWQIPNSYRVDSITNFQHILADEEGLVVRDMVSEAGNLTQENLEEIKQVVLNDPLLANRLISPKGDITGVNVSVRLTDGDDKITAEIAAFSRELKANFIKKHPEIDVYLTGMAMFSNAFPEVSKKDMLTLIPLMYLIVLVLTLVLLRSFTGTFATLLVILFSTAVAMGTAGWLGLKLTPISASVPTIVLTLAVADSIHLLMSFLQFMRKGYTKNEALAESLRINFTPVVITSVTTVIGFLGLNFSDAPPFHDLGNLTAVGVIAALIFSLLLLPAVIAILPVRVKPVSQHKNQLIDQFAEWVIRQRTKLLWASIAISLALISLLPTLRLNDKFMEYLDTSLDIRQATDFSSENMSGIYTMEFSLGAEEDGGINDPAYMAKIDEFANWLRTQPEVMNVNVLTDTLKRLNKSMNEDDPAWYKLPDQQDLTAQYLLLYEMSLPLGLDLNNQINVGKSATKLTATLGDLSTSEMQKIKEKSEQWLKDNAPASMFSEASSPAMMFTFITRSNTRGLILGTLISLGLITLTLGVVFRSVKFGLISIPPNVLPVLLTFGIWSILDGEVGIAAATVATITIGIVVDGTVHFVSKYLRARKEQNLDAENAVRYAFSTVGVALFANAVILVCGFIVLTNSVFKMNVQMGIFTVMTVTLALLLDFLLLPPLLMKLDRIKEKTKASAPEKIQTQSA